MFEFPSKYATISKKMSLKGAIFDLDGVLVNTVPLHFKAWKKMFEEYGHKFEMQDYLKKVDGRPRQDGARAILTEVSDADLANAGDKKQKYFEQLLDEEPITVFDSSIALVKKLKSEKVKVAVASSSRNTVHILERTGLKPLFDAIVTGNDFKHGKPDPEIFLLAAAKLGLPPDDCVVFEDAKAGVEAALRGGFFGVGIDRHNNPEDLNIADILVKDLGEVTFDQIKKGMEKK
ncbi:MAG: beta-phosphoglucomutase family hydrolase [bacterium]